MHRSRTNNRLWRIQNKSSVALEFRLKVHPEKLIVGLGIITILVGWTLMLAGRCWHVPALTLTGFGMAGSVAVGVVILLAVALIWGRKR